jgi:hypothetical protein
MTTTICDAWLTCPQHSKPGDAEDAEKLTYTAEGMDMRSCGWVLVGKAEIKLTTTYDRDALVASMVATLRAEIDDERTKSQAKIWRLERKIDDLLALPMYPIEVKNA